MHLGSRDWGSNSGDPSALLADEPTGSLDFRTGEVIMGLLEDLSRSRRLTSDHVTHNLNFARQADSSRVFIRFFF